MYTPVHHSFFIKVGFAGLQFTQAFYPDVHVSLYQLPQIANETALFLVMIRLDNVIVDNMVVINKNSNALANITRCLIG